MSEDALWARISGQSSSRGVGLSRVMLGWVGVKDRSQISGFNYTVWPRAGGSVTEHFEVNRPLDVSSTSAPCLAQYALFKRCCLQRGLIQERYATAFVKCLTLQEEERRSWTTTILLLLCLGFVLRRLLHEVLSRSGFEEGHVPTSPLPSPSGTQCPKKCDGSTCWRPAGT
jgi:hypothetical protein